MKKCKHYTGVHCIDGSCPKALEDDYIERGIEVPVNCSECWYHKGCEDCAWDGTEICKDVIETPM